MGFFIFTAGVMAAIGVVAATSAWREGWRGRREIDLDERDLLAQSDAWRQLAREHGGEFSARNQFPELRLRIRGESVFVTAALADSGPNRERCCTRVRVVRRLGRVPAFDVRSRVAEPCERGFPTRLVGVRAFDVAFAITTRHAPTAIAMLAEAKLFELLPRSFPWAHIVCEGDSVCLEVPEFLRSHAELEHALMMMVELSLSDPLGIGALHALPGGEPSVGTSYPGVELSAPAIVRLAPVETALGMRTQACTDTGERESWRVEIAADGSVSRTLWIDVGTLPSRVGAGEIRCEGGRLSFTWAHIELEQSRLLAGAELIAALAAHGTEGVYR